MEFGKLSNIDQVDWTLPPTDPSSLVFLDSLTKDFDFKIYYGAPAWGHKHWVGRIYPEKTKAADYLYHYSRKFSCIELNTSHYRIPSAEQTEKWLSQISKDFIFCPKVYQSISHSINGLLDKGLLKEWWTFLENLKSNLGPCFLQFPLHFDYSYKAALFNFLQLWPSEFDLALEFRHPSWFARGQVLPALTQYLQKRKVGLVMTDVAGRRDVIHGSISADYTMVRFIGNNLHPSDFTRAEVWAKRFATWKEAGLKNIYLIIHEPDDISVPEMANFFIPKLNLYAGTEIQFETLPPSPQATLL